MKTVSLGIFCLSIFAVSAPVQAQSEDPIDLQSLSIEELAQVTVRSASKREEPLSAAPTALYVITGGDIVSSGAMSLPEALRLAPNLSVQQVDASDYSITARGFNGTETANKLLVLIDGRTIYTPLASQVFYNLHSPLLEDLQQIEVISGPGGTLYGPNAVNGVINITSRNAQETLGGMVRGTAGAYETTAAARYGVALGGDGAVRIYGNYHSRDDLLPGVAVGGDDSFRGWQLGFRSDLASESDQFTLQGDVFRNKAGGIKGDGNRGFNLLGRWSRTLSSSASFELQAYYDQFHREFILVSDMVRTADVEGQLNVSSGRHNLVAGAGIRTTKDEFINNLNAFQLDPQSKRLWIGNIFVQDRIDLGAGLSVIPGIKLESSTFSGWQTLPSLRVAYQPNERHLLWSAVSRAVRTPSRIDRDLANLPLLEAAREFRSEKLIALEAGYRGQLLPSTNVSVSVFHNWYDDIRTTELSPGGVLPIQLKNGIVGRSWGVEAWGTLQLTPNWRVSLGGTRLWKDFAAREGRRDLANLASLGNDPDWQLKAGIHVQLSNRLQLTLDGRWVGDIETRPRIPSYVEVSGRIGWLVTDDIELFVAGRNLLQETHLESNDPDQGQRAQRSIVAGSRLRF